MPNKAGVNVTYEVFNNLCIVMNEDISAEPRNIKVKKIIVLKLYSSLYFLTTDTN